VRNPYKLWNHNLRERNVDDVLNTAVILLSIASSSASLGYWIAKQFGKIDTRFKEVEMRLKGVEARLKEVEARLEAHDTRLAGLETTTKSLQAKLDEVDRKIDGVSTRLDKLEKGIFGFNELLLKVLEEKGVVSRTEALTLLVALRGMIPGSRSKYYTKEVENRLRELLSKDPDTFTMDDIREFEDIAEIMEKEYMVSGRKELLDYAAKLRIAALVFKIVFVEPKMRKLEEWPLSP
jgi:DNA repair exonuclease SbcCD ATPase subunit